MRTQRKIHKVALIFGTRPEAIKLAPVILQLKERRDFQTKVIVTGQHRKMLTEVLKIFRIKSDYNLRVMRTGQPLADLMCRMMAPLNHVLLKEKPDCVIVQGDTMTTLVASLAAFYLGIPVAHVEAGLRTQDKRHPFPEEIIRRMVSTVADLHFAPTSAACLALEREGISRASIHLTGNTVIDAIELIRKKKNPAEHRKRTGLPSRKIILVTLHRRETFINGYQGIFRAMERLGQRQDVLLIYPVHPNPMVHDKAYRILSGRKNILLVKPLPYDKFMTLMDRCHFVLTDSGGIQEEVSTFNKPVLVARKKTERQEAIQGGFAKLVGYDEDVIYNEARRLLIGRRYYQKFCGHKNPFGNGHAAERIIRHLKTYLKKAKVNTKTFRRKG